MKRTKYDIILEYMGNHEGRITNIEAIQVARTTSPHKYLQQLVHRGLVKSEKAPNASYHIYSLIDKQMRLL